MKLYEGDILVLSGRHGEFVTGRWRFKCKSGFYFDFRDAKNPFKPESIEPIPGYIAPKKSWFKRVCDSVIMTYRK